MAKDRAAPFSKKHRRYWLPVLGGMIVIGIVNVAIGMCAYPGDKEFNREPEVIKLDLPPPKHPVVVDAAPGAGSGSDAGSGSGSGAGSGAR